MKNNILLILVTFLLVACTPTSKEKYMERYAKFMMDIKQNASEYTENEWIKCDEKYRQYSKIWYQKFQPEMTSSDKLILTGYQIKYIYYRNLNKSSDWLKKIIGAIDVDSIISTIETFNDEVEDGITHLDDEITEIEDFGSRIINKIDAIIEQEIKNAENTLPTHSEE